MDKKVNGMFIMIIPWQATAVPISLWLKALAPTTFNP